MDHCTGQLLVVDDDENNRDMLSRRLQRRGYLVGVAEDGPQAIEAIGRQAFDLILLDVEMPGMNGFDVLQQIRQTIPATQLPVIIATARGDREDVVNALGLGANDFVTKPLDFPIVLARVQTQLSLKFAVDRIVSLEADLRRRNVDLQQANDRMKRSLQLASRMQHSLLPAGAVRVPGMKFAWLYEPCDELGGDILNVFPLGRGHVGMYLLDVSGHGVPAALLSVTLSRMLATVPGQPSMVEQRGPDGLEPREPRAVVEGLNRRFQMSGEYQQYFTLFYGIIDVASRELRYVSAGHPPALRLPATGEPHFVDGNNFAVGWLDDVTFEQKTIDLKPADRFYLYSDGITETMNAGSDQFGAERLTDACRDARGAPLQQSLACLVEQAARFRGNRSIADDISALALEITERET